MSLLFTLIAPLCLLLSVRCAVTLGCHLDRRTVIWIDAFSAWVSHVSLLAHKWLEHEKCAAMVVVKWEQEIVWLPVGDL